MLPNLRLTTHHVGGREGSGPFCLPDSLAADAPVVFYEADPDAVAGMKSGARPVTAVAKCVGKTRSRAMFHITQKPHGSSLLQMSRRYAGAYYHKANEDPIMGVTFAVARTIEVEVDSLGAIVASGEPELDPPDVLTLDTEGTEYDILEGADGLLRNEIVAVVTEVGFIPLREGQRLFGDIAELLARRGFIAVRIQQHGQELSLYRGPVGLRGRGLQAVADAVFLKHPDAAVADWTGPGAAVKLRKLAIVALAYGLVEYALDCLARARAIGLPAVSAPPRYWTFLDALERCAAGVEARYLPVPGAMPSGTRPSSVADEAARPAVATSAGLRAWLKPHLVRRPNLFASVVRAVAMLLRLRNVVLYFVRKYFGRRSEFEQLLANIGFVEVSNAVRDLRLRQSPWAASRDQRFAEQPTVVTPAVPETLSAR